MKYQKLFFITALSAYILWLSWLVFLAANHAFPVVVSRSQMMSADAVLRGKLIFGKDDQPAEVQIFSIIDKEHDTDQIFPEGKSLFIDNLPLVKLLNDQIINPNDFYYLPVKKIGVDRYRLVAPPQPPGLIANESRDRPIIYPAVPEAESQLRSLLAKTQPSSQPNLPDLNRPVPIKNPPKIPEIIEPSVKNPNKKQNSESKLDLPKKPTIK